MGKETLQGHLNAKKESTLAILKERGSYLKFSEENGFMYRLDLKVPLTDKVSQLVIGMKNGWISILDMQY